jgi:ABC-type bacteriocin/lantibiotic exporter with double-glycine peptidase domain
MTAFIRMIPLRSIHNAATTVILFKKIQSFINLILLFIISILDGLSIASIIPFLGVILNESSGSIELNAVSKIVFDLFLFFSVPITVGGIAAIIAILFFMKAFMKLFARWRVATLQNAYEDSLQQRIFHSTLRAELPFIYKMSQGNYANTFTEQATKAAGLIPLSADIIVGLLTVGVYIVFLIYISPQLALITIGICVIFFLPIQGISRRGYTYGQKYLKDNQALLSFLLEIKQGIKFVKSLGEIDGIIAKRFDELRGPLLISRLRTHFFANSLMIWAEPLGILLMMLIIVLGHHVFHISSVVILFFSLIIIRLIPVVNIIFSRWLDVLAFLPSMDSVQQYIRSAETNREYWGGTRSPGRVKSIRFSSVSFSHNVKPILQNASFTINEHELVFLFGPSGVGKSTILDLLLGFYSPQKGEIIVNDEPMSSLDMIEWRKCISYIPQDNFFFNDSIVRNLCIRLGEVNLTSAQESAHLVGADEFIQRRDQGYSAFIGEGGSNFSGGQRQRLALSRGLTPLPQLLIVDEPTNALDSGSAQNILGVIRGLQGKATVLFVTHDRSLLRSGDKIISFEHGITESVYGEH